mmetsp:Transcript_148584/g.413974  ORF Transcript_148584/g.413974 Transcript_148584/m.413974 type:complete len:253 (+) Transcript_148584:268-1026(+)
MHGDRAGLILGDMQELRNDVAGWAASIQEVQVDVLDAMVDEASPFVLLLVKADDESDARLVKYRHIVFWRECRKPICISWCWARPSESQELVWDDPVHVSILNLLEELIRLNVKPAPVKPPVLDALLQSLQAVHYGEVERADATSCITKWKERRIDAAERLISYVGGLAQGYHLVGADQACRIGPLPGIVGAIVYDALLGKGGIHDLDLEHLAVPVDHRQVQWTKISEERLVHQLVVNAKVVRLECVLRRRV